jgi:hypothetical protein
VKGSAISRRFMQTYLQLPSPLGRRIDDRLRARTSQHPERLGMSDAAFAGSPRTVSRR